MTEASQEPGAPLGFSEEALWLIEQLDPGSTRYHIGMAARLRGPLQAGALKEAFRAVCERHTVLRTVYATVDGAPVARVLPASPPFVEADWAGLGAGEQREALEAEFRWAFDLTAEPPARGLLAKVGSSEHLLLFVFHHIAFDGWSESVFTRELAQFYAAYRRGAAPQWPSYPMQYREYAERLRTEMTAAELDRLAAPWMERLAGVSHLQLGGRGSGYGKEHGGGSFTFSVEKELVAWAGAFARANRVTAFAVHLAAFEALLSRYSGQTDFAIGIPYANREDPELEDAIGMFVNTLALRVDLSGDPSFSELIARAAAQSLDALSDAAMPFEKLVERMKPERAAGENPLFSVLFAYQNLPGDRLELAGLEVEHIDILSPEPVIDLSMTLTPEGDSLRGRLRFSGAVFDENGARRFGDHYRNLLRSALRNPGTPVSLLDYLGEEEKQRLLAWGTGPVSGDPVESPVKLFERHAQLRPERTALHTVLGAVSYAELDVRAGKIAGLLIAGGVVPGGYVGVLLERSHELVASWIGVWKAGCAYLPLDPADPAERLAGQLKDSGACAVIARTAPPAGLREAVPFWLDLSAAPVDAAPLAASNVVDLDRPACVMFSSGSTGRPKGAVIPQRAILRLLFDNGWGALDESDTWMFVAPPSFDATTLEVWGALLHGGSTVVMPPGVPSMDAIAGAIAKHGVSVMWITASLFNAFIDEMPEALRPLRLLMTGGESLSVAHIHRALRLLPTTRLLNGYGPTENTTFTTTWEIPRDFPATAHHVPIGRPIANTRVYVLDGGGQLVPQGVNGELYGGGSGVALGYLGLDELTAGRFLPDPFQPGRLMYRTGDFVRWSDDGLLEFVGRGDDQVKVRGFRIELGEIEAALLSSPEVREAFVMVHGDDLGKSIVAYYCSRGEVCEDELKESLRGRLPQYMLPEFLIRLEKFPLLPTGKIDRAALPPPSVRSAAGEPPRHGTEERLAAIWQRLLNRPVAGRQDNFFDLGGHSLSAVRLVSQIQKEFGVRLRVSDVFASPVLAALAECVVHGSRLVSTPIPLQPKGTLPPLLSFSAGPRFRNLALRLAPERPVQAIPLPEIGALPHPCHCEDLAKWYAGWLLEQRPEGPWNLTGWCLAGVIAFETARILQDRGEGAVVLVDTSCPVSSRNRTFRQKAQRVIRGAAHHGRAILAAGRGQRMKYLAEQVRGMHEKRDFMTFGRRYEQDAAALAAKPEKIDFQLLMNHAAWNYTPPGPVEWPVLLLRAEDGLADRRADPDWGWKRYAPRLDVAWASGDHGSMFESPYVEQTAGLIREWLSRTRGRGDGSG